MSNSAQYHYQYIYSWGKPLGLLIYDLSSAPGIVSRSVTNDIDNVLIEFKQRESQIPAFIVYRDSDMNWDEIIVDSDFKFVGFQPMSRETINSICDELFGYLSN